MKKNTLAILAIAFSLFFVASISMAQCPMGEKKAQEVKTTKAMMTKAEGETVVLNVSNMTCGACVNHVTKTLAEIDGVKDVTVNLEKGTAEVICDSKMVQADALTKAVVKAGYPTKLAVATDAPAKSATAAAGCAKTCGSKKGCDPAACGMKTAEKGKEDGK